MADVLKKFGRYFLLDLIAHGGMAEIYRARLASVDGAGRLIVIKRIQAAYGDNIEFLQMFRSEIKVTMGFNHPNIVQLYDFGDEQGQPYIAMELVDGKNLRQFMNRFNEVKKPFPIELTAYIIEQAASGLHYAHSFKDKITGKPLNIIHRDISPQNILISYEGTIKVIDFGIAKATTNMESTRAGVIKGKPSYLSPEQISGEPLDGRSDIFALGVVFWELLVGRKLFAGDNDLAVLKQIESCQTSVKPPSAWNPSVPKELDAIIMKALAKQREKRYQTAEEVQRALHRFLYGFFPDFNPTDLSYYARDLFKNEIVEDRKRIQRLNEDVEKLLIVSDLVVHNTRRDFEDEEPDVTATDRSDQTMHTSTLGNTQLDVRKIPDLVMEHEEAIEIESKPPHYQRRPQPPQRLQSHQSYRPSHGRSGARVRLGTIAAAAAGILFLTYVFQFAGSRGRGLDSVSEGNPIGVDANSSSTRYVRLRLNVIPQGNSTTAKINGKAVNMSNPVMTVPVDTSLELVVQNPKFKTVQRQFVVDSGQLGDQKEWSMDIQLEPFQFGYLSIRTTPSADAVIMIDGKPWKKRTPFEREQLPVGTYTVRLSNDLLEMDRTLTVEIKEGELTQPYDPDREASRELKLNMSNRKISSQ